MVIKKWMDKMDIDEVKTKVLIQHYIWLGGSKEPPASSQTLKYPKKLAFPPRFGEI